MSAQEERLAVKVKSIIGRTRMFRNYRPEWMRNPKTGKNLEFDIYLPDFKVAIEFQGAHHFRQVPGIFSNTDFVKERDEFKRALAKKRRNVTIIEMFEQDLDAKFTDLFLERAKVSCRPSQYAALAKQLKDVQDYARLRSRNPQQPRNHASAAQPA